MAKWHGAILALGALLASGPAFAQAQGFTADFTWEGTAACFDPQSPPFSLGNVPAGTKTLEFRMQDLDAPSFPHGGGTVAYAGQSKVPRGAFSYKGPCPPHGQHRYMWTVKAEDGAGKVLAVAQVMKKFPPQSP
ncbi:MAG TPA: YbhB/YbcL family Raf kinase inhibitor-like protein [Alphaproteobacteria bacterium]|nr:YbhB/YbcL family Raf kinase inhibitor-like protein [Alphaproteobacteria bacterium]